MADLLAERRGATLLLTLNRPSKRNAFSWEMLQLLEEALRSAAGDAGVRAVVVTGAGGKSFSAGMDLSLLMGHLSSKPSVEKIRSVQGGIQKTLTQLEELKKPTLAAIEGACVGGGLELALACDVRIASSDATFAFPEVKIGMVPDLGGSVRIARALGPLRAKEWIMTGRTYPAPRAFEAGLLNELSTPGGAAELALKWAEELSALAPLALGWAKRIVDRSLGAPLHEGLQLEQEAMTELLPSEDLGEGISAFLEKRPPRFTGR
jgi:enoyl-CoA hydratase/carnithine racemase